MAFEHVSTIKPEPAEAAALAPLVLQRKLGALNRSRLVPALDAQDWEGALHEEYALRKLEAQFVEAERAKVQQLAWNVPRDPAGFVAWFERLEQCGPGQGDPLFPWLAEHASREQMRWFLQQEIAGEAGFEDLLALTQLRFPVRAKLELARNFWDEMGCGHAGGMHGPLLARLADALALDRDGEVVWESLALGNLMTALAANRRYAYQSLGALGVIELTAPGRAVHVNAGLKRLGVSGEARRYFALHATLDVKHSAAWNREVLEPLVAAQPAAATALAEGALLRLNAGARCFERYRRTLFA